MGIPRFFPRMNAAGFALENRDISAGQNRKLAIIDAAALAHFCLSERERVAEAELETTTWIESIATYTEVCQDALKLLRSLRIAGLEIHKIFFDGGLPTAKRSTRLERLKKCAQDLNALAAATAKQHRITIAQKRQFLPPKPFIVTALLEAVLGSEFVEATYVVPGEADNYCVAAARELSVGPPTTQVLIFSNDSDLTVFRHGVSTQIVLLNSLKITEDHSHSAIVATVYKPAAIAKRIGCLDLVQLAYLLFKDPHLSVAQAQTWIDPGRPPTEQQYRSFAAQYNIEDESARLEDFHNDDNIRQLLIGLDARLSELAFQANTLASRKSGPKELEMYLPFLIEDTERGSAWKICAQQRNEAYRILCQVCGCPKAAVLEFKRAGQSISARKTAPGEDDLVGSESLESLYEWLSQDLDKWSGDVGKTMRWRHSILRLTLIHLADSGSRTPRSEDTIRLLTGERSQGWEQTQASACYQAAYYSLRILHQTLRYSSRHPKNERMPELWSAEEPYYKLSKLLDGLPGIATFFEAAAEDVTATVRALWLPHLEEMLRDVDDQWKTKQSHNAEARKRKKQTNVNGQYKLIKRKETGAKKVKMHAMEVVAEAEEDVMLAGNPFAALVDET